MATKRRLERRISSTEDMSSIVGTMKALAAVNVRVFQRAQDAIDNYLETVERGIQVALRTEPGISTDRSRRSRSDYRVGMFVFGSVQGMCGQFNEHISRHAQEIAGRASEPPLVISLGDRVAGRLADRGLAPERQLELVGQIDALPNIVDRCIVEAERLQRQGTRRLVVCYNRQTGQPSYEPAADRIFPLPERTLEEIDLRSWPTRQLPLALTPVAQLISSLLRQYLFSSFYRAAVRSLAAENAARLAAMQSAQKNIDERLDELHSLYNRKRQAEITEELLDIVSGFSALEEETG